MTINAPIALTHREILDAAEELMPFGPEAPTLAIGARHVALISRGAAVLARVDLVGDVDPLRAIARAIVAASPDRLAARANAVELARAQLARAEAAHARALATRDQLVVFVGSTDAPEGDR